MAARTRLVPLLLVAVWALTGAPAVAAGLRGVADAFLLDGADAAALLDARPGAPAGRGAWFRLGQARLWGMPELPVTEMGAGAAWALAGGTAAVRGAWERTGRDLVRGDRQAVALGWRRGWEVQLEAARERLVVLGETVATRDEAWLRAGPDLSWGEAASLSLRLWALLSPPPVGDRQPRPAGRAVLRLRGGACAVAWDRRADGRSALGIEAAAALGEGAALAVRWDGASASLGPGLVLRLGPLLLRTSHLEHPALGLTHRFELVGGALDAAGN
ncbi:MAG: hypothetical protein R6X35_12535 [Candidatus Krumholzibacteriia bacterium]